MVHRGWVLHKLPQQLQAIAVVAANVVVVLCFDEEDESNVAESKKTQGL